MEVHVVQSKQANLGVLQDGLEVDLIVIGGKLQVVIVKLTATM
jgi:hypothetical protein